MLKQSSSRNQRAKGFRVKHGFQVFLLIAVGVWLLYQLKRSHDKKKAYEESSGVIFGKLETGHEIIRLGRKGLLKKPYDLIDDAEDTMPENIKGRIRGGDDDIVGPDQERVDEEESEEVEDLIDEEDKEKEEEESEDMEKQIEVVSSVEDQGHKGFGKNTNEATQKHFKESVASRTVMQGTKSRGTEFEFEFEFGSLRKVKEEEVGNSEKIEILKRQKKTMGPSKFIAPRTESGLEVVDNVTVESGSFPDVLLAKVEGNVLDLAN